MSCVILDKLLNLSELQEIVNMGIRSGSSEPHCRSSNPSSATSKLADLEKVIYSFGPSISISQDCKKAGILIISD